MFITSVGYNGVTNGVKFFSNEYSNELLFPRCNAVTVTENVKWCVTTRRSHVKDVIAVKDVIDVKDVIAVKDVIYVTDVIDVKGVIDCNSV